MITHFKWFILLAGLGVGMASAQTDTNVLGLPDVTEGDPAGVSEEPALPDTTAQTVDTMPLPMADPQDQTAEVRALRATFEALKQRDAQNMALRQAASKQTLDEIERLGAAIDANRPRSQTATWKAKNLATLQQAFASRAPGALPPGIPAGTEPDIALAVIAAQTTLYSQPMTDAQMVIRTVDTRTTMLRVAEISPYSLVWSSQDGFAFVLSQFRQVY